MLSPVNPKDRPSVPYYSQGMLASAASQTLYISGQVGVGPDGRPGAGIAEQAQLAVANMNAVLAEAGMTNKNLAKVTIYLTDDSLIPEFMAAAGATLPSPPPATTLLVVKGLAGPELLVEIEGVAVA